MTLLTIIPAMLLKKKRLQESVLHSNAAWIVNHSLVLSLIKTKLIPLD